MRIMLLLLIPLIFPSASVSAQSSTNLSGWDGVTSVIEASDLNELVVIVGNADGILYQHAKGFLVQFGGEDFTVDIYSASKWLTAATIMQLVEQGVMSLDDRPQDYLDWWTAAPSDPRSQVTLAQLLSFTSGFSGEPLCIFLGNAGFEDCARRMYDNFHNYTPGTAYVYSSTHMHIAGVMAEQATGRSFNQLFRELVADPLGISEATRFATPSETNPWPAGGGQSTANDYARFLEALLRGDILARSRAVMFRDWTAAPVQIVQSPMDGFADWHYALGAWRECYEPSWAPNCADEVLISSGGAAGWFPWIDVERGYYGLIARNTPRSVGESILLATEIRPHIHEALGSLN
ncbi:MAG: beta-lactamase family protein [Chloroflexi bacterium]|nr:beta-lactamase family protein [Chloroflexota bacterium]